MDNEGRDVREAEERVLGIACRLGLLQRGGGELQARESGASSFAAFAYVGLSRNE